MNYQNDKIRRKLAIIHAKKVLKQFSHFEFIKNEEQGSVWLEKFENTLKRFRKIDSTPTFQITKGEDKNTYLTWIEESLGSLRDQTEWLIIVPNCNDPIWANVRVLDFSKAIEELWDISESNEFTIAEKNTPLVAQVYSEEGRYEIHVEIM